MEIHRRQFALKDIVLISPAGAELSDWLRVIKESIRFHLVRQESSGNRWYCQKLLLLLLNVKTTGSKCWCIANGKGCKGGKELFVSPEKYFWQGSPEAPQAFVVQLIESFPELQP